jgi:hypothetical protein
VPGALGAVLCALAVVPVWGHSLDRTSFGRVWVAEPVWGADPWWSLALLLGVAACLLAVLGRRPRARLFTAAAVAVSAVQLLTLLHRAWDTEAQAVSSVVVETRYGPWPEPVSLLPLLVVPVAVLVLVIGLAAWRRHRGDRWGAAAIGVAATVVVSGAVLAAAYARPERGLQVVVDAGETGGLHGSGIGGAPFEGWLDGPERLPERPGWVMWAVTAVLLLLLLHLRRGRDGTAGPHGRPGGARKVRVAARGREVVAVAFVAVGAAVGALALSPGWAAWWAALDPGGGSVSGAWWDEMYPWWEVSPWWPIGAGLGVVGSASAVRAVRARTSTGEGAATADTDPSATSTADRAVLASWAAAGVFAVHAVWDLSPVTGSLAPAVVAVLLAAQAIAVALIGAVPLMPPPDGGRTDATR